ncbi:periplasmic heavy metal sensor [Henriciella sp.]|uniref:periplasmic heavy metal sensor n=1 Tax=Henriciella sp. TaxID=1968823 RepID=UPI002622BF78|nr:periplasmic heavy metal sensor [Henriciella sp.]
MSRRRALSTLGIALVVSLIANALLIGLILGNAIGKPDRPHHERGPRGGGEEFEIARGMESVMPDSAHKEMRQAFREAFREARPYWVQKRQAQQALRDAMDADPFDRSAVEAAFTGIRDADQRLTRSFHTVLADELSSLTLDQREDLVGWLKKVDEERRARWREHHDRRPGGHGDRHGPPLSPPGDEPPN